MKRNRKLMIALASVFVFLATSAGAFWAYVGDYYHADMEAIQSYESIQAVHIESMNAGAMIFSTENATKGLIFYPGGKVEYEAYQPLMAACAERGFVCVLLEMPFNLAVFDSNAADGILEQFPQIEDWYIGGHSLGGAMAASYLSKCSDDYEGLILLGSYSTEDLSGTDLDVLSIYGSEDLILNKEKYDENRSNLPEDFTEVVIEGGCHSYFGMYGAQDGDGIPMISVEEQLRITVDEIVKMAE